MEKSYSDIVEYTKEVDDSIKEILETFGVSASIKKQDGIMRNVMLDLALETFIPMEGRVTASMVGYEMDMEPTDVAIFISLFFAFQKVQKEPKGVSAFFRKKQETEIDNKQIVRKIQKYVIDEKELFDKFMANLNAKIALK